MNETTDTVPSRPAQGAPERLGTLALVGSCANRQSLAVGPLVTLFGSGAEIGRRPPPGRMRTVVTLAERSVSAYHAQITNLSDGFMIEDKGSTNGTMLDGRPVTAPALLREGAVLFLGSQVAVFRTMTSLEIAAVEADIADPFAPVATLNPPLATTCAKLRRLAPSSTELFLLGKTGVGKEVFASAIHARSGRKGRMMAINCAALPRELVESELFGYVRGAHSTATERKVGLIEAAEGGTLFLDELSEMPLDVQNKLLRFLQDRVYTPVGATRPETANVRIIAASSSVSSETGLLKIQDALLGRLGAQPIQLPALRERPEDLGRLVSYFLRASGCDRPFEEDAFRALFLYGWPHNIRELQKVIIEAELLSRGDATIGLQHLPPAIGACLGHVRREPPRSTMPAPRPVALPQTARASGPGNDGAAVSRRAAPNAHELRELMRQFEGNVTQISNHLGRQWAVISRALRRHGIDPADYRPGRSGGGDDAAAPDSLVAPYLRKDTIRSRTANAVGDADACGGDGKTLA